MNPAVTPSPAFLSTLISVCSGTDGFTVILRRPLWRAVFHFCLLALLCLAATLLLRALPAHDRLQRAFRAIENRFGALVLAQGRLLPTIAPDTPRAISLGTLRIDYFPDESAATSFSPANFAAEADRSTGWLFKRETCEFRLNWTGTDSQGINYLDY